MNKQGLGLWIVVVVLLVLDIGVHCVRAQDDSAKIVKTQHLQLVDSSGNIVADFDTDKNSEPELLMYDEKGNGRLGIYAGKDGGQFSMFDAGGNHVCDLLGGDAPDFTFFQKGNAKADMGVNKDGSGNIVFYDDSANPRAAIGYSQGDDESSLFLMDKDKHMGVLAFADKDVDAVTAMDSTGKVRAAFSCTSDDQPGLGLFGTDGSVTWKEGEIQPLDNGNDTGTTTHPGQEKHTPDK